ncbi:hypothetical protein B0H13DRAFT_2308187 [Mycena leptocephala]|nr:hypothetical protein B0H13DRAFT_2308187 [Mycena leptocephala]
MSTWRLRIQHTRHGARVTKRRIIEMVSDDQVAYIRDAWTAAEMWSNLRAIYQRQGMQSMITIHQQALRADLCKPTSAFSSERSPSTASAGPAGKGKGKKRNASPGPSTPLVAAAAKEFIEKVNLPEIPPNEKRYDGKAEGRALQMAGFYAEFQGSRADTVSSLTGFQEQLLELGGVGGARSDVTLVSPQLDSVFSAVQTILSRIPAQQSNAAPTSGVPSVGAAAAPVPAAASASAVSAAATLPPYSSTSSPGVIVTAPPPYPGTPFPGTTTLPPSTAPSANPVQLPPVALVAPSAHSLDGRIERMEALLREMASSKRAHSPTAADDARVVRARVESPQVEALTTAFAQAPATTAPIAPSPVIAAPTAVVSPAPVPAPTTALAPTAAVSAPAPAPVHVAPSGPYVASPDV